MSLNEPSLVESLRFYCTFCLEKKKKNAHYLELYHYHKDRKYVVVFFRYDSR